MRSWEETRLWALLCRGTDDHDARRALLAAKLPDATAVLRAGGTSPTDFTLHDDGHAFRVAERILDVIPHDVHDKLGAWELCHLLLAAYLHDVGMTPARGLVAGVHDYIFAGSARLDPGELASLKLWLDQHHSGLDFPLNQDGGITDALELARLLTAHYARSRHNEWSAAWTRASFATTSPGEYPGFVEDLVLICQSHHEGYSSLASPAFDPRLVGPRGDVVHPRYLACALRVSDILDLDPERTPDVIFRHRDISAGSLIYWYKDHDASVVIADRRVAMSARPTRAILTRANGDTATAPAEPDATPPPSHATNSPLPS